MSFRFHRILCSTPPPLEAERLVFEAAIGRFNEEVCMAEGALFAAASFLPPFDAARRRPAVEANIRHCQFFVQLLDEQPPEEVFRGFIDYAIQQASDPAAETAKAGVLFRVSGPVSQEARDYRDALAAGGRCEVGEFGDEAELAGMIRSLLEKWYEPLRTKPDTVA